MVKNLQTTLYNIDRYRYIHHSTHSQSKFSHWYIQMFDKTKEFLRVKWGNQATILSLTYIIVLKVRCSSYLSLKLLYIFPLPLSYNMSFSQVYAHAGGLFKVPNHCKHHVTVPHQIPCVLCTVKCYSQGHSSDEPRTEVEWTKFFYHCWDLCPTVYELSIVFRSLKALCTLSFTCNIVCSCILAAGNERSVLVGLRFVHDKLLCQTIAEAPIYFTSDQASCESSRNLLSSSAFQLCRKRKQMTPICLCIASTTIQTICPSLKP